MLIMRAAHVLALEPDARMRVVLADTTPEAEILAGTAEEIPVPDASCDAVIASSAWHWVDEERAAPEVARVLRSGGCFSLLWNGPDRNVEWMRSLWEGGKALGEEETQAVDTQRRERHVVTLPPDSPFAEPERWSTRWTVPMTKEELVGLAATYSRVITMDAALRQALLGRAVDRVLVEVLAARACRRSRPLPRRSRATWRWTACRRTAGRLRSCE
jgi:SAM-dependent methyltransferase